MRIKELLERTGKKQKDLREKLNVASSTMSQYVNGQREPGIEALIIIADFFGVSVDYLIGHDSPSGDASPAFRKILRRIPCAILSYRWRII